MKDDDVIALLVEKLRWLRLPGMAETLPAIMARAAKDNLTVADVVQPLVRRGEGRVACVAPSTAASRAPIFPRSNTVDAFDFDFDPCRKKAKARYLALHDLAFIDKGINPLFIGRPGTGKTFLVRSLAYRACQSARRVLVVTAPRMLNELHGAELHGALDRVLRRYVRAELLVIDDFALLAMDPAQAKLAFQVISERYDYRRPTAITTNRPFKDWTKVFPDALTPKSSQSA